MTVHHWGENPVGTWYLSILDVPQKSNSDKKGLLRKWTLELHGTAEDPQPHWIPPGENFLLLDDKNFYLLARDNQAISRAQLPPLINQPGVVDAPDSQLLHGCRAVSYSIKCKL